MKPLVIYPYGALVDLVPLGGYRVYGVEFEAGVIKVGVSKNLPSRLAAITRDARRLSLAPARFFFSESFTNAKRVESAVLDVLRSGCRSLSTPADFPASSEWFDAADLERVHALAAEWAAVLNELGQPVALRLEDLDAKDLAEATALGSAVPA